MYGHRKITDAYHRVFKKEFKLEFRWSKTKHIHPISFYIRYEILNHEKRSHQRIIIES